MGWFWLTKLLCKAPFKKEELPIITEQELYDELWCYYIFHQHLIANSSEAAKIFSLATLVVAFNNSPKDYLTYKVPPDMIIEPSYGAAYLLKRDRENDEARQNQRNETIEKVKKYLEEQSK